jgi:hypothetical protein
MQLPGPRTCVQASLPATLKSSLTNQMLLLLLLLPSHSAAAAAAAGPTRLPLLLPAAAPLANLE